MDLTKVAACTVLAMLALSDLRSRRLPNLGVAAFAALYVLDAALTGSGRAALVAHAAAGAFSLAAAALLVRLGWLGGGDAKLAAAVFLWSGPTDAVVVLLIVTVCGTFIGLALLAIAVMARSPAVRAITERLSWVAPTRGVPYGVALAAGGALAVLLQPASFARGGLALVGPSALQQIGFALFHHARFA
jgi:prepilin peptidase CpaA